MASRAARHILGSPIVIASTQGVIRGEDDDQCCSDLRRPCSARFGLLAWTSSVTPLLVPSSREAQCYCHFLAKRANAARWVDGDPAYRRDRASTEEVDGFCAAHARLARGRPCKFMQNENLITRSASLLGGHSSGSGSAAPPDGTSYLSLISAALSSPPPLSRPQRAWTGPP